MTLNTDEPTTETTETTQTITTTDTTTTKVNLNCTLLNCTVEKCNFGRKLDSHGCETCDCLKGETTVCQAPYCHPCFYGSITDTDGCDTCNCKPRPKAAEGSHCPKLDCDSCNYGAIKDEFSN